MPPSLERLGQFDILVAGGGVVGAAGAIRLARLGARVALVDAEPSRTQARRHRPGERISARTCFHLEELGIPALDVGIAARPSLSTWPGGPPQRAAPSWPPARLVERRELDAHALDVAARAGVHVLTGRRVTALGGQPGDWRAAIDGTQTTLTAAFFADATGRRAVLARTCGAERLECDRFVGLVRRWSGGPDQAGEFLLEPVGDGWLYAAGLANGDGLVGWMSFSDLLRGRGRGANPGAMDGALARSRLIGPFLNAPRDWADATLHPSSPGRLSVACGPGWAALGDAALHTDPIEGQGIGRGLEMAEALEAVIAAPAAEARVRALGYSAWLAACLETHLAERLALYEGAAELNDAFLSRLARPAPGTQATAGPPPRPENLAERGIQQASASVPPPN